MLQVQALSKNFGKFQAVRDLSFTVRAGEVTGLVGPNGAGKTTTLRCLTGIIPPSSGEVSIGGVRLDLDPVAAKRQLAFFPDEPRLFDHLSVWQHLVFTARLYQVSDFTAHAESLLTRLNLMAKRDALPAELSRGMKQKLSLACGLLHRPRLILFDEPLTGLDPAGIRDTKEIIRGLSRDGAAILISSHLLSLLEEICSHVLIIKDGAKVADGTLEEIRARFASNTDSSLEDIFFKATEDKPATTA